MTIAPDSRRQVTLFVPAPEGVRLDALRRILDPIQASLISAHVTLCREDEIAGLAPEALIQRALAWPEGPLSLAFGPPQRFNGHGVLLPCVRGSNQFQRVRQWLLKDQGVRVHSAHLTLAHPRNPRSTGNSDRALAGCPQELALEFPSVALIEKQGRAPWRLLHESRLGSAAPGVAFPLGKE